MASQLKFPERFIGMHFFNPATIMKLVEIVKGQKTSTETCNKILEFTKRIGKIVGWYPKVSKSNYYLGPR